MKIQYAPLDSDISSDGTLTSPWFNWINSISKNMENGCRVFVMSNYTYGINNNILTVMYSGNGNESILLPYQTSVDSFLKCYSVDGQNWNQFFIDVPKGSNSITIPVGQIRIKDFLIIDQKNK